MLQKPATILLFNSSYGEAYTQLFIKYNKMINKANSVNMADLDVTEKNKNKDIQKEDQMVLFYFVYLSLRSFVMM